MHKKAFWLASAVLVGTVFASQNPGAVFLMIWPAARPTAMGGAFTAIADDASAVYYNQGGMGFLEGTHATLMHANWLPGLYPGMYYEYGGLTHEVKGLGSAGLNVIYLTTGETEVINERGEFLGRYTTFDVAVAGGYGYPVLPTLGIGCAAKFIYSFLVPEWVWKLMPELGISHGGIGVTWALDAGLLYKPWRFLSVGASVANVGPNISYTDTGEDDPLPRMLRVGLAYYPVRTENFEVGIIPMEINKILVGMFYNPDGNKTFGKMLNEEVEDAWKSIAVEGTFRAAQLGLSARVGYFEDVTGQRGGVVLEKESQTHHYSLFRALSTSDLGSIKSLGLCFGAGIEYAKFKFDLSIDQLIYDFPTSNYKFSFSYQF